MCYCFFIAPWAHVKLAFMFNLSFSVKKNCKPRYAMRPVQPCKPRPVHSIHTVEHQFLGETGPSMFPGLVQPGYDYIGKFYVLLHLSYVHYETSF